MFEYILSVFVLQVIIAISLPKMDARHCVLLTFFWVITVPFCFVVIVLDNFLWQVEIEESNKLIGFRRPNDNWPGFAITLFKYELQIFKVRN